MKVVDANVLVHALAGATASSTRMRLAISDESLAAPHQVDLEVVDAWRRHHLRGLLSDADGRRAIERLTKMAITRHDHAALLPRCWQLRDTVRTYDAAYVALAEALGVPLLTADARLANAPGITCEVELLT